MPTVDELLNVELFAEIGDAHEQEIYCIILPDSRTIEVPEEYQLLGVAGDKKAERLWFQCPKIVGDNIDLSKLQIRINYQNANGDKDQYIVEDVETNGDNIEFSWLLSRKVTMYRGTVNFVVCAVKVSDETIQNEWNTTLATSQVLEGLEVDTPEPTEEQSDVIAQLMQMVQNTSAQAVQAVQAAERTAIENISELPKVENHVITFSTGG